MSHRALLHEYREHLAAWRAPGSTVAGVQIVSDFNGCASCLAMAGMYRLECAPVLPDHCENLFGCAVRWGPVYRRQRPTWREPAAAPDIRAIERLQWFEEQFDTVARMLRALNDPSTRPGERTLHLQTCRVTILEIEMAAASHPALPAIRECYELIAARLQRRRNLSRAA